MSESIKLIALAAKERKRESREKKLRNQSSSAAMLSKNNISYESKNDGNHLVVHGENMTVDFWPSTGKFIIRGDTRHFRGVKFLIKIARGDYTDEQMKALQGER
jgi:hypothetical protein